MAFYFKLFCPFEKKPLRISCLKVENVRVTTDFDQFGWKLRYLWKNVWYFEGTSKKLKEKMNDSEKNKWLSMTLQNRSKKPALLTLQQ